MFEHSVKVPRLYKAAAKIAKEVVENKGSLKTLVYDQKHANTKALYALISNCIKYTKFLEIALNKSQILEREPRLDAWLAKILITELLWGKGRLPTGSKPVDTILNYQSVLNDITFDLTEINSDLNTVPKPRYVRVNTLFMSVNEAIDAFRDEGWTFVRFMNVKDYDGFIEKVANLQPLHFMVDIHIKELLIFPPNTQFHDHKAYKDGLIFLQDKASCLPVHFLDPKPESTVLDLCAAPGMKTSYMACKMENKGKIYAVDINSKRLHMVDDLMEKSGIKCVQTINKDLTNVNDACCPNVEYILVDPTCSGTGMIDRIDIDEKREIDQRRVEQLFKFQILALKRALRHFPHVKRVVYSTCSLLSDENERVVREVLTNCSVFKLIDLRNLMPNWKNFGNDEYGELGKRCLYSKPDFDRTNGFFVAVFERLEQGEVNEFLDPNRIKEEVVKEKINRLKRDKVNNYGLEMDKKFKKNDLKSDLKVDLKLDLKSDLKSNLKTDLKSDLKSDSISINKSENEKSIIKKNKKKSVNNQDKNKNDVKSIQETSSINNDIINENKEKEISKDVEDVGSIKKKKSKKRKNVDEENVVEVKVDVENENENEIENKSKTKKQSKEKNNDKEKKKKSSKTEKSLKKDLKENNKTIKNDDDFKENKSIDDNDEINNLGQQLREAVDRLFDGEVEQKFIESKTKKKKNLSKNDGEISSSVISEKVSEINKIFNEINLVNEDVQEKVKDKHKEKAKDKLKESIKKEKKIKKSLKNDVKDDVSDDIKSNKKNKLKTDEINDAITTKRENIINDGKSIKDSLKRKKNLAKKSIDTFLMSNIVLGTDDVNSEETNSSKIDESGLEKKHKKKKSDNLNDNLNENYIKELKLEQINIEKSIKVGEKISKSLEIDDFNETKKKKRRFSLMEETGNDLVSDIDKKKANSYSLSEDQMNVLKIDGSKQKQESLSKKKRKTLSEEDCLVNDDKSEHEVKKGKENIKDGNEKIKRKKHGEESMLTDELNDSVTVSGDKEKKKRKKKVVD